MTHAFSAQFVLLTQGSKVGASFAEKLNLFKKKAVNMYRRYPEDRCGKVILPSLPTDPTCPPCLWIFNTKHARAARELCLENLH